jgi:hypothetical protein
MGPVVRWADKVREGKADGLPKGCSGSTARSKFGGRQVSTRRRPRKTESTVHAAHRLRSQRRSSRQSTASGPCTPSFSPTGAVSCHVLGPNGLEHQAWLAEGPSDPREAFARAVISGLRGSQRCSAYKAPFERRRIDALAGVVGSGRMNAPTMAIRDDPRSPDLESPRGSTHIRSVDGGFPSVEFRDCRSARGSSIALWLPNGVWCL